jgi:hypothetical protein
VFIKGGGCTGEKSPRLTMQGNLSASQGRFAGKKRRNNLVDISRRSRRMSAFDFLCRERHFGIQFRRGFGLLIPLAEQSFSTGSGVFRVMAWLLL